MQPLSRTHKWDEAPQVGGHTGELNTSVFRLGRKAGTRDIPMPTDLKDEHEPMEPVPVTTEPTYMNAESQIKEPVAPVSTDLTDPQAEPETEEPVAPVPLTPPFPFLPPPLVGGCDLN